MEQTLRVLEGKTDGSLFGERDSRCSLQENPGLNPSVGPGLDLTGLIEMDYHYPHYSWLHHW